MAIGDTVTADRFNNLQTRITRILGFGGGDFGYKQGYSESTGNYGPAETSSQVSTDPLSNRNIATAADINELYIDLLRARIHQIGLDDNEITDIIKNTRIIKDSNIIADGESFFVDNAGIETIDPEGFAKGFADFELLMDNIEVDKFVCHSTQGVAETGELINTGQPSMSQRTDGWNTKIEFVVKAVFDDFDHRRAFFNSGGEIRMEADLNLPEGAKSGDWANLLNSSGIIKFGYNETIGTAQGIVYPVGNNDLTLLDYQLLFSKSSSGITLGGIYAANTFTISAKLLSDRIIEFKYEFDDADSSGEIDDLVVGDMSATIGHFRAKGVFDDAEDNIFNVEVPPPLYEIVTELYEGV